MPILPGHEGSFKSLNEALKSSSQNLLKQHQGQQVKKGWNRLQNQPVEHVKWDE